MTKTWMILGYSDSAAIRYTRAIAVTMNSQRKAVMRQGSSND